MLGSHIKNWHNILGKIKYLMNLLIFQKILYSILSCFVIVFLSINENLVFNPIFFNFISYNIYKDTQCISEALSHFLKIFHKPYEFLKFSEYKRNENFYYIVTTKFQNECMKMKLRSEKNYAKNAVNIWKNIQQLIKFKRVCYGDHFGSSRQF